MKMNTIISHSLVSSSDKEVVFKFSYRDGIDSKGTQNREKFGIRIKYVNPHLPIDYEIVFPVSSVTVVLTNRTNATCSLPLSREIWTQLRKTGWKSSDIQETWLEV